MSDDFAAARDRMVERLESSGYAGTPSTIEAMREVPRHEFVPPAQRSQAYRDRPLPIGDDQTISAPHMVAKMVDLLELTSGTRVLEIGTGCGYHAAVVAEIVGASNVFSVEVSNSLATETKDRLKRLGYGDISIKVGDGSEGWPEYAPFDACYLTCAAPELPEALLDQVIDGGAILAPIGTGVQELVLVSIEDGTVVDRTNHGGVRFVPLR